MSQNDVPEEAQGVKASTESKTTLGWSFGGPSTARRSRPATPSLGESRWLGAGRPTGYRPRSSTTRTPTTTRASRAVAPSRPRPGRDSADLGDVAAGGDVTRVAPAGGGSGPRRAAASPATLEPLCTAVFAAFVTAAVLSVVLGFVVSERRFGSMPRVSVPGSRIVSLDAGAYTIYYQGRGGPNDDGGGLSVTLSWGREGSRIPLSRYRGGSTFSFGGRHESAMFTFRTDSPGEFFVQTSSERPRGDVLVGRSVERDLSWSVIAAVALALAGVAGAEVVSRQTRSLSPTAVEAARRRRPPAPLSRPAARAGRPRARRPGCRR